MLGLGLGTSKGGMIDALALATNTKSVIFDGGDEYISCGNNFSFLDDPDANEFTISAWIKGNSGADGTIFSKADSSNRMIQLYTHTDDKLIAKIGSNSAISGATVVADGNWHNVALVVRNDGGTYKGQIYLDGSSDATETAVGTTVATDRDFLIGARRHNDNTDQAYLFTGNIDEVAIWDTALSSAELLQIYNSGKATLDLSTDTGDYSSSADLQAWWRMGDGTLDEHPLVADQTNATLGTALVPNLSDNGDYDGADNSNWYISTGDIADWTVNTNTSTAFGVTKNGTDTGDLKLYFTSDNTGLSSNPTDDKVYKLTYTLATTGTLPSDKKRFWDGASFTNLAVGTNVIYFRVHTSGMYIQFRTAVNAENFTLSNINIEPVNANAGLMTNMASDDIESDTP